MLALIRAFIRVTPLVGGPPVPLHSAFLYQADGALKGWDFVPIDPTSPATLGRLLRFQSAPAEIRELTLPATTPDLRDIGECIADVDALRDAAFDFNRDLHLVTNNCWRHTLTLAELATGRAPLDIALMFLLR